MEKFEDRSDRSRDVHWKYQRRRSIIRRLKAFHVIFRVAVFTSVLLLIYVLVGKARTHQVSTVPPPVHPVLDLIEAARSKFKERSEKQSKSLDEAVNEYKQRYGISPPPHFDKWYEFVVTNGVPLRDEYDEIFKNLRPFWGVSPAFLREKVATAVATNYYINGLSIRNGAVNMTERGEEQWPRRGIKSAVEPFAHLLPDMDLAFNKHDEPRTIIPYDHLAQLLQRADRSHTSHRVKRTKWSPRPNDLDSLVTSKVNKSPFIDGYHPFTWPISTLSCSPDSPARALNFDGTNEPDAKSGYSVYPLNFVQNRTAVTDICNQPSLEGLHSAFNSPNVWSITHDPIPIFSASKPSTFHDILFPAPWYLAGMAHHDSAEDRIWWKKKESLYWRGVTTSGYSDKGAWHFQNRQRFVESVEKPGWAWIILNTIRGGWVMETVQRANYWRWFDVGFWAVDNCSDEDCNAQMNYFEMKSYDAYETNWKHKFLLDIDGNAFSGRFYTFLRSNSLTLKQALFREWHEDRIVPWVHYIPLGFNGTDHLELMRFFIDDEAGQKVAEDIANESKAWAEQSLRHLDMQAWMFRLLLEYARLIDDNRHELGYTN